MQSFRSYQVNLLVVVAVLLAAQNGLAQTAATEELESRLREEVVNAVVTDPALHGVWADIKQLEEKGFELNLVVDSQPEIEQLQIQELSRVVKSVVKSVPFQIKVVDRLPFKQMLDELRTDVELTAEMAGASVEDAYYFNDSGDEVFVILVGRVLDDSQRDRMTQMSNLRIRKMFGESVRRIQLTKTKTEKYGNGVIEFHPSSEVASFCFNLGLQSFIGHRYEEAYRSFTQAHLDSPRRADIQYWRVVSLLGSGRDADAKRLLQGLVDASRRTGSVPKEPIVYRSLEQVQGPLRWRLISLENSLLCKTCN